MRGKNTIIINGRAFDATTGQPSMNDLNQQIKTSSVRATFSSDTPSVSGRKVISDFGPAPARRPAPVRTSVPAQTAPKPKTSRSAHTAHTIHRQPERSHTLLRQATKRPAAYSAPTIEDAEVKRSPMISRFAAHPTTAPVAAKPPHATDTKVIAQSVSSTVHAVQTPVHEASRNLKESLIKERLSEAEHAKKQNPRSINKLISKKPRTVHVATMCLALVMLGGYFTYINMPNLSVRVASARSGVEASYPEYRPDGYRFNGPVAYSPGEVTLKFSSNSGQQTYEVKQRASNWDSQAVLDNFVTKESASYLTYSEQGLTIYTYSNKAAWVNGGVLYTIDGDAPLSSEQVLRIAASM